MIYEKCSECKNNLYQYIDQETGFIQKICWGCGLYEDNSPAFRLFPDSFKDIVREHPAYFMRKFAHQPTGNTDKTTDKEPAPQTRFCQVDGSGQNSSNCQKSAHLGLAHESKIALIAAVGIPIIAAKVKIAFAKAYVSSPSSAALIIPLLVWYVVCKFSFPKFSTIWSGTLQSTSNTGVRAIVVMDTVIIPIMIAKTLIIYLVTTSYAQTYFNMIISDSGGEKNEY